MAQTENLGGHVPPVPPWFLYLCSAERTQITVLQFTLKWNGLQQYYVGGVTYVRIRVVLSMV